MAFYATFLQDQFQVLCDLFIHIWNQARHCFKNGNLRSKCGIYGCKFYTDHTTTDDNQTLWNFFQLKKFITCQNSRKIHSRNRKNQWFGTRSQNDILCFDRLFFIPCNLNFFPLKKCAFSIISCYAVCLQKLFYSLNKLSGCLLLIFQYFFKIISNI